MSDATSDLPRLIVTPHRAGLAAGRPNVVDVLVRVQAPDAPAMVERPPFDLALVIDRSGSMSGPPLAEARRCAHLVIDRLARTDRLAIVAYDHEVRTLAALQPVADRDALRLAVDGLCEGGSTDLHAGWHAGAEQLAAHERPHAIRRVVLLSDGQANHGVTDTDEIANRCAQRAAAGITTSTYGLGRSFNEDLMTAMARAGRGSAWYGETVDDLREPFEAELDLLRATFATAVTLRATLRHGIGASLRNDYPKADDGAYALPALAYGAEVWAVLRLRVPPPAGTEVELVQSDVSYRDAAGNAFELRVPPLRLPVVSPAAYDALPADELVGRRLAELDAAALHARARTALRAGDLDTVAALLQEAARLGEHNPWVRDVTRALEALLAGGDQVSFLKEAAFSSHRMRNRTTLRNEGNDDARDVPPWAARKRRQGKTGV